MQFLNPAMFWWLFALLVPVVVHLFNFRRHQLFYFSNIQLLKNLQEQTNKQNNLKHLLVLISRLLFIAALVFAFAQPYSISETQINPEDDNIVGFYMDNSMSMQLRAAELSLLDETRQHAINIARKFGLNNRFFLFSNDFLPQHQRSLSLSELTVELEQLSPSAPPAKASDVLIRAENLMKSESSRNKIQFFFSDFQKSTFDVQDIRPDSSMQLFLVPATPSAVNNIFIDSCWFESPVLHAGIPIFLKVRVGNAGNEEVKSVPVNLEVEGQQTAVTNVDIAPNSSIEIQMQFSVSKTGYHLAKLSVLDFPVVFDDELYFSFQIRSLIQVLEIYSGESNSWLNLLYGEDEHIQLTSVNRLQFDVRSLSDFDMVILSGLDNLPSGFISAVEEFVHDGGSLVLIPSAEHVEVLQNFAVNFGVAYSSEPDTFNTRVFSVETQHPLLQNVFLNIPDNPDFPVVFQHFPMQLLPQGSARTVVQLLNGSPLLASSNFGKGAVYALAVPLDKKWSDFPSNSLFVPVFYRMALISAKQQPLYFNLGNEISTLMITDQDIDISTMRIKGFYVDNELIPGVRLNHGRKEIYLPAMNISAGHYGLFEGDELKNLFAINDQRTESQLEYFDPKAIVSDLQDAFKSVQVIQLDKPEAVEDLKMLTGVDRWYQYFVLLALFFLLAEIAIIRFWK